MQRSEFYIAEKIDIIKKMCWNERKVEEKVEICKAYVVQRNRSLVNDEMGNQSQPQAHSQHSKL